MTSRKANKERTRSRLIQATLKILHRQGPGALTTGRIAEAAGVAQPTFYVHFEGMNDALEQAAEAVAEGLLGRLRDYSEGVSDGGPESAVRNAFELSTKAFLGDKRAAALLLRHRRDVASPLGKRWSELVNQIRADLLVGLREGGVTEQIEAPEVFADMIIGMVLTLVEGVLDGRVSAADLDDAIDTLARTTSAGLDSARGRRKAQSASAA